MERTGHDRSGEDGRRSPALVQHLVKLPIIDRLKVVKDIVLGELDSIHSDLNEVHARILAVHGVVDALRENESPQLQTLITLVEALQHTRLEVERHARAVRGDVRHARDDAQRLAQEIIELVRSGRQEVRQQADFFGHAFNAFRQDVELQEKTLLEVGNGIRREILEHVQVSLNDLRVAQAGVWAELRRDIEGIARALAEIRQEAEAPVVRPSSADRPDGPELRLMAHLYSHIGGRVAVDVGANIGDTSRRLLDVGYDVFAFEPYAPAFHRLSERLSKDTDFHAFPWALGSTDETRQLHIATDTSGCGRYKDPSLYSSVLEHSMPDDLVFVDSVPVTVRSLESLHRSRDIPPIVSLVKIDAEGFDLEIIRGMGAHRYAVVVAEYWDRATPFGRSGSMNALEDMVNEMKQRGYHWYIVFYRIWGKVGVRFYCNYERSIERAFGNVFFFQEHAVFAEALKWCEAVVPVTYLQD
jgi:FkbM family methyltransferase